jgi:HEAT repeat protein
VGALSHHRGPAGEQLLLHALLDPDIDVRTAALRTIVGMGSNSVMNSLLSFTESDDFKVKDLQEKKRFFLALARLGGHLLVPHFEEILSRKKFFERTADTEQKICAIHALESVGSDRARELLEEVARTQSGAIKERAAEALKTLRLRSANGSQAGRP